ncbi:MAG: hypothetical protein CNLJKLNK_00746 [Holosporales bacterium]
MLKLTFEQHDYYIESDSDLIKKSPYLQTCDDAIKPDLYFVHYKREEMPIQRTCLIQKTWGELYAGFDTGILYGLLDTATDLHVMRMVQTIILDIKRAAILKNAKDGIVENRPIPLPFHFSIRRFDECFDAAQVIEFLSPFKTERDILTGVHELLLNAIEHGNLGLKTEDKINLYKSGNIFHHLMKKLNKEQNLQKDVHIFCTQEQIDKKNVFKVSIKDCGPGFKSSDIKHENQTRLHGRGAEIALLLSFDDVYYNPNTKTVDAIIFE